MKSLQEIFDTVTNHLLTQQCRAENDTHVCRYRVTDEEDVVLKCAVGCLIDDQHYNPGMEGRSLPKTLSALNSELRAQNDFLYSKLKLLVEALEQSGLPVREDGALVPLLAHLQYIHDDTRPQHWEGHLVEAAQAFGLTFNFRHNHDVK
ncbi:MAG: hypothetical protein EBU46_00165 [Nitrosomonadaceae bacterium]|nr:hypothetical protein [Nitrosomonadaceae bacterium]